MTRIRHPQRQPHHRSAELSGATLRSIRTTSKNGAAPGGGSTVFDYTPVVDAPGNRYRLFVRDEVPFSGADGLVAPGTF